MKIHLDRLTAIRLYGFSISFYFVMFLLSLVVMVWQMPASWVAGALSSQTHCRLALVQPAGSIWRGSAAFGFSEPNPQTGACLTPNAVTERFQWDIFCDPLQAFCQGQIQFSALVKPLNFRPGIDGLRLDANEATLPANILEVLGSPWTTLRPRGEMRVSWAELDLKNLSQQESKGVIRILVNSLSSPISTIEPLGSYDVILSLLGDGGSWDVSTVNGPLLLQGSGTFGKGGLHFSGGVSASPESQESLIGLLSLMGKKTGDIYSIQF